MTENRTPSEVVKPDPEAFTTGAWELPVAPTLLLVEDCPEDVLLVRRCLSRSGLLGDVQVCGTLREAQLKLAESPDAVVLSDLSLPDSRGLATVRAIRQAAPDVALVVLSGNDDEALALRATTAGADDWIVKSDLKPRLLRRTVRYARERRRTLTQLAWLANTDTMTGLPNRRHLSEELVRALARARRNGHRLTVLVLDLDRLKTVNDLWGHEVGDRLIEQAGARMRTALRDSDYLARMAGDEFAILTEDLESRDQAGRLAERLVQLLGEPFDIDGRRVEVGASVGIVQSDSAARGPDRLLQAADLAMYRAKEAGRGGYEFHVPGTLLAVRRRLDMQARLGRALGRGELRCGFQPIVSCRDSHCTGAEALMRWRDADGNAVASPVEFIPAARAGGLLPAIARLAVEQTVALLRRLDSQGLTLSVSVNVTASDLADEAFVSWVVEQVEGQFDGCRLRLELTEDEAMSRHGRIATALERLRAAGVKVAMDDFGTGYSSMARLHALRLDVVKLDRTFVAGLPDDTGARAITGAALACAIQLGMSCVAEGVETQEQFDFLASQGCHEAQGWLFGAAMPVDGFLDCLAQRSALSA